MTQAEKNIKIAEACGIKPRKNWGYWIEPEKQNGFAGFPTKEEAERNHALTRAEWLASLWGEWPYREVELYDDWSNAPDYFNDLPAIHSEVRKLDDARFHTWTLKLCELGWEKYPKQTNESHTDYINRLRVSFAGSADEQAEAFGRALNLW